MCLRRLVLAGILASSLVLLLSCATPPAIRPLALLQRPQRPQLSTVGDIQAAVQEAMQASQEGGDLMPLLKLYAHDVNELISYARQLEALLDAVARQKELH